MRKKIIIYLELNPGFADKIITGIFLKYLKPPTKSTVNPVFNLKKSHL